MIGDRSPTSKMLERFNSLSHGVGVWVGAIFLVLFVLKSNRFDDAAVLKGCMIYCAGFVLMFASSAIYHAAIHSRAKDVLRIFDHSAIFIFIAASYTPVALYVLHGLPRLVFLSLVWFCALNGLIFKIITFKRYDSLTTLSVCLYLIMGWLAVFFIRPLVLHTSPSFLGLIVSGGCLYSVGTIFYKRTGKAYNHGIWHVFVLSASFCHMVAIYFYMV